MSHDVTYAYESGQGASDVVFEGDRVVGATKVELFEQGGYTDRLTVEGGPAKDVVTRGRENLAEREKVFADIARAKAKKSQVVGAGLQVIGGAAATVAGVVGAGFGGLALAAYGLDNVAAGTGTLATGKQQKTGLNRALKGTAEIAGASEEQAANVADYGEFGIGVAIGVTQSVRAGFVGGPSGASAIPDEILPPAKAAAPVAPSSPSSRGPARAPDGPDDATLFHGTDAKSASSITRSGLDTEEAAKLGGGGRGCVLGDNRSRSGCGLRRRQPSGWCSGHGWDTRPGARSREPGATGYPPVQEAVHRFSGAAWETLNEFATFWREH